MDADPRPLPAVVLAAGASSRMSRPKALLDARGRPFVGRIADTLRASGLDPVLVVTRAELAGAVGDAAPHARVLVNPDPDAGQLSSLRIGLSAAVPAPAALVTLVDLPLVRPDTIASLLRAWRASQSPLVRPSCRGRHGHPVIFGAGVIDALLAPGLDLQAGAKPVVRRFASRSISLDTDDEGTIRDVDTPDDYEGLFGGSTRSSLTNSGETPNRPSR
ncbi:MAG TPA: nucleotidyltransferase family protein [Vicinamibacterales bacterium]